MSQKTWSETEQKTDERTVRTVNTERFLGAGREADRYGKYVRVFPAEQELRCYREVGNRDKAAYWRTVVPVSNVRLYSQDEPVRWDLHDGHAETFLTWLSTLSGESATVWWDSTNNSPLIKKAGLNQETLSLSGQHEVVIDNVYQHPSQMMANYK